MQKQFIFIKMIKKIIWKWKMSFLDMNLYEFKFGNAESELSGVPAEHTLVQDQLSA